MFIKIKIEGEESIVVKVDDNTSLIVGRSSKASLPIKIPSISRSHIKIRTFDGKFFVTDLGSANGSYINQDKLPANEEVEWPDFFTLHLSDNVSLEIVKESVTNEIHSSVNNLKTIELDYGTVTIRKLKSIPEREKTTPKPKDVKEQNRYKLLFLVIIGFAAFYVYQNHQEESAPSPITSQDQSSTNKQIPQQELIEISTIKRSPTCQGDLAFLCDTLKIKKESNEGIYFDQQNLYLVLDFRERILNAEFDPSYSNTKDSDVRLKYLKFHLAFITLNEFLKGKKLQKVFIEDGSNGKTKSIISINGSDLVKYSMLDLQTIFSALLTNQTTLFDSHMAPLAKEYSANIDGR
jgi:hypothetical protein